MPMVFENPPALDGPASRFGGRERTAERKELDDMLSQLASYPDSWARLYDFTEEAKEDAEKTAGKVRSAASALKTGHGWSVTVRRTDAGWAVFARMSSQPVKPRVRKVEPQQPEATSEPAEQAREATFQ
jgi:hypothetical protein